MVQQLVPKQLTGFSENQCLTGGLKSITANEVYKAWIDLAHYGRWPWWIEVTKWE